MELPMPRSVFVKTLLDMQGQVIGWSVGLGVVSIAMMVFFPQVLQIPELQAFMSALPKPILAVVGDPSRMTGLEGLLQVKLFDMLPLLLAVFAVTQGASAIAGEEERGTLDLLLSQPVRRWRVLAEKLLAMIVGTTTIALVLGECLVLSALALGEKADLAWMFMASLNVVPITVVIIALALLGSCIFHHARRAATLAGAIVGVSYFLMLLSLMVESVRPWGRASLFHYYARTYSLQDGFDVGALTVLVVLFVLLAIASAIVFQMKEIRT
jgi:ABC-2 type transport system permease protein